MTTDSSESAKVWLYSASSLSLGLAQLSGTWPGLGPTARPGPVFVCRKAQDHALPELPDQAKTPSSWMHLVPATGIFLLPKAPLPFALDLSLLHPNESGIRTFTQHHPLCHYVSLGFTFAYKVFYSHIF